MAKKTGLGRGLDSLFLDNAVEETKNSIQLIKISQIDPKPNQPRKTFENEAPLSKCMLFRHNQPCVAFLLASLFSKAEAWR